jgi:hypothetical protein
MRSFYALTNIVFNVRHTAHSADYYFRNLSFNWYSLEEAQWFGKKELCKCQIKELKCISYAKLVICSEQILLFEKKCKECNDNNINNNGNYQDDINHSLTASHPVCILTRIHPYCHPSTCFVLGNTRH